MTDSSFQTSSLNYLKPVSRCIVLWLLAVDLHFRALRFGSKQSLHSNPFLGEENQNLGSHPLIAWHIIYNAKPTRQEEQVYKASQCVQPIHIYHTQRLVSITEKEIFADLADLTEAMIRDQQYTHT